MINLYFFFFFSHSNSSLFFILNLICFCVAVPRNAEESVADADFADCVELQPEENEQGAHTTTAAASDVEVRISNPFYFYPHLVCD
jgi:hypothetical protein